MTRVRLTVGAVAHGGHCVARHEGRVIFVRYALPGEVVEAELTDSEPDAKFWRAEAVEILEASADRVESPWPEAGPGGVGGGELAHVALPAQRQWKLDVLRESFQRFAKAEFPGTVSAAPGDDDRGGLAYRTRVTAIADTEGRAAMRTHRSHTVHTLTAMPLAVADAERALLDGRFPAGAHIGVAAPSAGPVRVFVNGKPSKGGRIDSRDNAPSSVRESIEVAGTTYEYKVPGAGFWQVHREAPALLIGEVLARVGDAASVLDLYSGSGLFTVPLAAAGKQVTSVESDEAACKAARRNVHDLPGVTIVHGDVRRTLKSGELVAEAAVLDPPRSGAGKFTLEVLAATGVARIVYVACDPVALARDTAELAKLDFDLVGAEAFDLFPMTHHVEAVATFQRR